MNLKLLIVIAYFSLNNVYAQTVLSATGARSESLGNVTAVVGDQWSLWRNPAGLSSITEPVISSGVRRLLRIGVMSRSVLIAVPTSLGNWATGASSFGDDIYNESALSLGWGHKIGITSIGARGDMFQLRIPGYQTVRSFGLTIGATISITDKLSFGVSARNINLPEWVESQPLPIVMNAGIELFPSRNFLIAAEVEKNSDLPPTIKGAFEYSFHEKVFARTGFNLFPNAAFAGLGLKVWRLMIDYSFRFGYLPGIIQQLSISLYPFKKRSLI